MATIGHGLVGLSLSELCPPKARGNALPYVWIGLVVALAYAVDLIEWIVVFTWPEHGDKRFLTHAPWLAISLSVAACALTAAITRMRSPTAYAVMVAAVLSHLVLDAPSVRALVVDAYGYSTEFNLPGLIDSIIAECWLYGLIFVEIALFSCARDATTTPKSRAAALVLAGLSVTAAATRWIGFWGPIYALSVLHVGLCRRRRYSLKMLWSIVPTLPLLVVPLTQGAAGYYTDKAARLRTAGDPRGALILHKRVLAIPTRKSFVRNYIEISRCHDALDEPERSEAALKAAVQESYEYGRHVPNYWLARFYMNPKWKGTPYYRPEEAARILREIIENSDREDDQRWAYGALHQLRDRKELTPP